MRPSILIHSALIALVGFATAAPAAAQEFALQVGPSIAGGTPSGKKAVLVVRPGGCANPSTAEITGTAEGLVAGTRRSVTLTLAPLPTPGVHAVSKEWPDGGFWVVNLVGTCAGKTAGALVSIPASARYERDQVKLLTHRATPEEINASLKALAGGQR